MDAGDGWDGEYDDLGLHRNSDGIGPDGTYGRDRLAEIEAARKRRVDLYAARYDAGLDPLTGEQLTGENWLDAMVAKAIPIGPGRTQTTMWAERDRLTQEVRQNGRRHG